MKKLVFPFLLSFFLMLPVLARAERQLVDRVVAVVNEEVITQSELDGVLRPFYEQYKQEFQGQELFRKLTEVRQKLLSQMIEDRLVYFEAKKEKIEVNEADIEEELASFKGQFKIQADMEKILREQGMTLTIIRDRIRRQSMVRTLQDREIRSKVVVSPEEIDRYFQDHPDEFSPQDALRVRSITLKKNDQARASGVKDEESWQKIQDLREKIVAGEDFGQLAKQASQDSHAEKEGLGDWIKPGDMIPEIDDVIFKMKAGEVSEVIETSMGYHLFKVEEKKPGEKRTLEEARGPIHEILFRQKSAKRFENWMTELKRAAYISVH